MLNLPYRIRRWREEAMLACMALLLAAPLPLIAAVSPPLQPLDRIVAIVNDDVITATELEQRIDLLEQQLRQQGGARPPRDVLRRQLLERLILTRIQLQLADATGIRIDDETLNTTLTNIAAQNNLTLSEFREVLEADGFDFAQFREEIRQEIIIRRLRQRQVESRITVTEQEIDNFLINQRAQGKADEEYRLGHILIALPEAASPEEIRTARARAEEVLARLRAGEDFAATAIAVSDGQQALEGGDLGWRKAGQLPTLFADRVRDMAVGDLAGPIRSPSGFHLIKLLDKRHGQRHVVTQTRARHILIRPLTRADGSRDDDAALAQIRRLRERLLAGEDFAELAQAFSDDKASAIDGGDLGWVSPGQMVPEFERAMTALAPGEISEPVKSGFGWHLIQVLERREHDDTETRARNQARNQIFQRKVEEAAANWLRRLRDEAYVEYRL